MSLPLKARGLVKHGLDLMDRGQFPGAVHVFGLALKYAPKDPDVLHLMAVACFRQGAFERAEQLSSAAASIKRGNARFLNTVGLAKRALGKTAEAQACFEAAVRANPLSAEASINLASGLPSSRAVESHMLVRRALLADLALIDALAVHASKLALLDEPETTSAWHRRALAAAPDNAGQWNALGRVLLDVTEFDLAEPVLRRAAILTPEVADPWNHLGYLTLSRLETGLADGLFRQALAIRPDLASAHRGRGEAAYIDGDVERAIEHGERALSHAPADMGLRYRVSLYLLAGGQLERGWLLHDCLWSMPEGIRREGLEPARRWHDGPFSGGRLLVLAEQGVGDEVLFLSCLPELVDTVQAANGELMVECDPRLIAPLRRAWPTVQVHGFDRRVEGRRPVHRYDWIPSDRKPDLWLDGNGLMPRFRQSLAMCEAADRPWLVADPARVDAFRECLDAMGPGLKVGVSWRSRSLEGFRGIHYPGLAAMAPILATNGVQFVSLQYGDGWRDELAESGTPVSMIEDLDTTDDLDGVLALIAALDLVICPSSTLVWLAASIGAPVWLPYNSPTYLEFGTDHFPGFPTVRGFAKSQREPWAPLLGRVADALAERAAHVSEVG